MIIEDVVYDLLSSNAGVLALVADRIYPQLPPLMIDDDGDRVPPDVPFIVYTIESEERPPSFGHCPLCKYEVKIEAWGSEFSQVKPVMVAVAHAFEPNNVGITYQHLQADKAYGLERNYSMWINTED